MFLCPVSKKTSTAFSGWNTRIKALELNFVIPNMELQSGKRLQPYYYRADRPRINAWQTLVNHHYGLRDPNAPENRRTLVTPNNLPKAKQEAAEAITRGLEALYHAGAINASGCHRGAYSGRF